MPDKFNPFGQKIAIKAPPPTKIQVSSNLIKAKAAPAAASVLEPSPAPAPAPAPAPKFTCPSCGVKLDACPVCKH